MVPWRLKTVSFQSMNIFMRDGAVWNYTASSNCLTIDNAFSMTSGRWYLNATVPQQKHLRLEIPVLIGILFNGPLDYYKLCIASKTCFSCFSFMSNRDLARHRSHSSPRGDFKLSNSPNHIGNHVNLM